MDRVALFCCVDRIVPEAIHSHEAIKVSGPRVQTFCIEKDSHMDGF